MCESHTLLWFTRINSDYTVALQDVTLTKSKRDCNNIDIHLWHLDQLIFPYHFFFGKY